VTRTPTDKPQLRRATAEQDSIVDSLMSSPFVTMWLIETDDHGEITGGHRWNGELGEFEPMAVADALENWGGRIRPLENGEFDRLADPEQKVERLLIGGKDAHGPLHLGLICPACSANLIVSLIRQVSVSSAIERRFGTAERQLDELMRANDSLVVQVTEDFEELTFLRSISEYLECSDESIGYLQMAETMIEPLARGVRAAQLSIVTIDAEGAYRVELTCGCPILSEAATESLLATLGREIGGRPYVQNHFDRGPLAARYPNVERLMVVKMASTRRTLGYLVAVNRASLGLEDIEARLNDQSHQEFGTSEAALLGSAGSILASHAHNVALLKQKEDLLTSVIRAMVSAIEAKDQYTRGHSDRVALFGQVLAKELGLSDAYAEKIFLSGLLHDVGKIGVSDATLRKPGKLTDEEYEEIKRHPDEGWAILQDIEQLRDILPGVLYHHERIDGRGYPDGLRDQAIPLDGRILAVADAWDAMTSDRPYRRGMPPEKAESILREGAGTQWDSRIVDAFFRARGEIERVMKEYDLPVKPPRVTGDGHGSRLGEPSPTSTQL